MSEHIDVDVSAMLTGEMTLEQAGRRASEYDGADL